MYRSEFERIPIQDRWSRMLVVAGQPGNRSDLVTGWLSTANQDKFVPVSSWTIDPFWGKNFVDANWLWTRPRKSGDADMMQQILRSIAREQWSDQARWAVSKSHWTSPVLVDMIPAELGQYFFILDLLVNDPESLAVVKWESFVKNMLMHLHSPDSARVRWARANLKAHPCVPADCDDDRVMVEIVYKDLLQQVSGGEFSVNWDMNTSKRSNSPMVRSIEYRDVMTDQGSLILEDVLELKLNHDLWSRSLELSISQSRYHVLGQWWERPF